MDIFQALTLPFYVLVVAIVFLLANLKFIYTREKIFSRILVSLLILSITGLLTGIYGPQLFGLKTQNLVIPTITVIFLLTLGYALVRLKIFNPSFILYKIVTFISLFLVLGITFTFFLTLVDFLFASFAQFRQVLVATMLSIIAILLFYPLKNLIEKLIGKIFFSAQLRLEKLEEAGDQIIAQNLNLLDLVTYWLEKFIHFTKIPSAAIILFERQKPVFSKFISTNGKLEQPKHAELAQFTKLKETKSQNTSNYSLVVPLIFKGENRGVLICGPTRTTFSAHELEKLEKIAAKFTPPLIQAAALDKVDKINVHISKIAEKYAQKWAQAKEKLAHMDQIKDEFISLTSHELRTPLTGIKSYLYMVLSGKVDPVTGRILKYLNLAYSSTERMIKLVNDLLNISQIESGRIEIKKQGVSILELTKTVLDEFAPEASKKGLKLEIEQKDLPLIFADWAKIHEVLVNLVGNAIKFTPSSGKVKIGFTQTGKFVKISIRDTGCGIAAEDIPRLFHKFGLLPGSLTATRQTGGSGLGLYIAKALIDLHGGQIQVKSKQGEGSEFTFTLPLASKKQLQKDGIFEYAEKIRKLEDHLTIPTISN